MIVSDKQLIFVSCLIGVSGLIILLVASILLEKQPIHHDVFVQVPEETMVTIQGEVISERKIETFSIFTLSTECTVPIVSNYNQSFAREKVRVVGKKTLYKGLPQIQATKIIRILKEN